MSFFVSADHAHLQDVSIPIVAIGCTPGKSFYDQLAIPDVAVAADGSFSSTTTQDGVLFGVPAHFTYTFSGHMHGPTSAARAEGMFRERITYDDGTAFDCNSNLQRWSTLRDAQGDGAAAPPPAGSYSGGTSQGRRGVVLGLERPRASPDRLDPDRHARLRAEQRATSTTSRSTTSRSRPTARSARRPHTTRRSPASPDTSPTRSAGHFHGPNTSGAARAAGTFRERITYDDGTAFDCNSNTQTWTTTRTGA